MSEILVTVIVGSLLGSLHCVGMCGGFVAFYSADSAGGSRMPLLGAHAAYNLGRLVVYTALGAVAGTVGAALNLAGEAQGLSHLAAIACGTLIVASGTVMLLQAAGVRGLRAPAPLWLNRWLGRVVGQLRGSSPVVRATVLGMSSTLLPCGWLYGFAVTAAGTGSTALGTLVMAAFWLGTVPAMLGVGLGIHHVARAVGPRLGVLMPLMLILMGVFTLLQRGVFAGASPVTATLGMVP